MRNLKRALSLALASVMLLGMMMIGTSAVSIDDFNDSDTIQNQEAVTLTAGLGIFEGRTNGDFDPTAPVSRAEMAVIICKILHGADVAPSNFTGVKAFTDVPAWAEGYVNMCSSLGIIAGRGNGIFDPDATVTTVEASTMLLKALGYYRSEDVLGADWKLVVTSRATQAGVVKDMKLDVDAPLTRDNVAQMTYNTLFAQMVAYDNGRTLYVKNTDRNTVVTASTEDDANTLAYHTFHLWSVEGIVVANGYTTKAYMETTRSAARTQVMFTEPTDLDKDGRNELDENEAYDFEYATDLDLIGHNVKVYYQKDGRDYKVFTMFDKATLVAYIDYDRSTTKLADRANAAGFQKDSILNFGETPATADYVVNYDWDVRFDELPAAYSGITVADPDGWLDQLLVISNSANKQVDVVIALDQMLNTVKSIEEFRGETDYELTVLPGDEDIPWKWTADVKEDDYVISTNIGLKGDIVVFEPADIRTGDLSRIDGTTNTNADAKKLTFEGTVYTKSNVYDNNFTGGLDDIVSFVDVKDIGDVTLAFDAHDKVIAQIKEEGPANYAYVAQFGYRHSTSGLGTDENELTALVYDKDGNSKVYIVDRDHSTTRSVLSARVPAFSWSDATDITRNANLDALNGASGTANYLDAAFGGKGVYRVEFRNNNTKVRFLTTNFNVTAADPTSDLTKGNAAKTETHLIKGHSTFVNGPINTGSNVTFNNGVNTYTLMNDSDTLFFYVTGSYRDNEKANGTGNSKNTLSVRVVEGIKNVANVDNYVGRDDTLTLTSPVVNTVGIRQAIGQDTSVGRVVVQNRAIVGATLITGVSLDGVDVYYFNRQYSVIRVEGGYAVEYTLYENKTGDAYTVTYNDTNGTPFSSSSSARDHAEEHLPGFYVLGANDLKSHVLSGGTYNTPTYNAAKASGDDSYYVVLDVAQYDEFTDNLFSQNFFLGSITENVKVVDACDSGLTSVSRIVRAIKTITSANGIKLSYSVDKDYNTAVLFVVEYKPDGTTAPGAISGNLYFQDSMSATPSGNSLTLNGYVYANNSDSTIFADGVDGNGVTATYRIKATVLGNQTFERTITTRTATVTAVTGAAADVIPNVPYLSSGLATYEIDVTWKWTDTNGVSRTVSDSYYW